MFPNAQAVLNNGKFAGSVKARLVVYLFNGTYYLIEYVGSCWSPRQEAKVVYSGATLHEIELHVKPQILSPASAQG